jgi:sorbitol-specific phosphotransferase system component IIC
MSERKEALMRILIGIVTGIILSVWRALIQILVIFHFIYVLITGERMKELAEFCEIWNTQIYKFLHYMTFNTNERVFPFAPLGKNLFEYKK